MNFVGIDERDVDRVHEMLRSEAEEGGYRFNTDKEFTRNLVSGLLRNEQRYGYRSCPCRLATGKKEDDLDIICPCDYRDADVAEFGACYCALYVSDAVARGTEKLAAPVPERRPPRSKRNHDSIEKNVSAVPLQGTVLPLPVWRCRVCGYLCARENPPDICPICKAHKDRFERFF
jgi:ferredoxin-thioredoxin reductase catalytic chain